MPEIENKKINDSELDKVSGGAVFDAAGIPGSDPDMRYEVINETDNIILNKYKKGDVIGKYNNSGDAAKAARNLGLSDDFIGLDEVNRLRGNRTLYR